MSEPLVMPRFIEHDQCKDCPTAWCVVAAEDGGQAVTQSMQSHWQHCILAVHEAMCTPDMLPSSLCVWSELASTLTLAVSACDSIGSVDEELTAAVAVAVQLLQWPFKVLERNADAAEMGVITAQSATQAAGLAAAPAQVLHAEIRSCENQFNVG